MAAALKADVCEIYTDVDGVFTADPRIVPDAQRLDNRLLRGDARDGRLRRQGAHAALRRVRPPLQRARARPLVIHDQARNDRVRIDGDDANSPARQPKESASVLEMRRPAHPPTAAPPTKNPAALAVYFVGRSSLA
ncbi:hypothetical protein GS433_23490 [Rhodococcus hoagii]|nr:hypothetical protein [Prescottella equi]